MRKEVIYVPKKIGLKTEYEENIMLRNNNGQWLGIYERTYKYYINSSNIVGSDNTGKNYKLVKVKKPKKGKLYYMETDRYRIISKEIKNNLLTDITNYCFMLDDYYYIYWCGYGSYYNIEVDCIKDKYGPYYFYEVVKINE
jgi:hypothetical protein